MNISDKRLIDAGYITKAKVKWYGGGFAKPFLWSPKAIRGEDTETLKNQPLADGSDYYQSWGDPRKNGILSNLGSAFGGLSDISPSQTEQQPIVLRKKKKKRGQGM